MVDGVTVGVGVGVGVTAGVALLSFLFLPLLPLELREFLSSLELFIVFPETSTLSTFSSTSMYSGLFSILTSLSFIYAFSIFPSPVICVLLFASNSFIVLPASCFISVSPLVSSFTTCVPFSSITSVFTSVFICDIFDCPETSIFDSALLFISLTKLFPVIITLGSSFTFVITTF